MESRSQSEDFIRAQLEQGDAYIALVTTFIVSFGLIRCGRKAKAKSSDEKEGTVSWMRR